MKIFALIGKPNVGKSTLFNRLARKRMSIVDHQPGVTRDRNLAPIDYQGNKFVLIDTGGFEAVSQETVSQKMREQSQLAVEEADGVIFLLDRISGWTHRDSGVYDFLRRSHKPVYFAVNKVDSYKHEDDIAEFFESGVSRIFPISAEHGLGISDLLEAMAEDFPTIAEDPDKDEKDNIISLAVAGRPNVGKSSLVNRFLGQDKQIVHSKAGTTRDPVDNYCKHYGQTFRLTDTAGIRKKSKVSLLIEKYSIVGALRSIERSEVVLLMIDAEQGVSDQDTKIAGHVVLRGKSLIIVVNKWDLIKKDSNSMKEMEMDLRDKLHFVSYAPILFVSAKTGQRTSNILETVKRIHREYNKRIQTSDINRILRSIVGRQAPPIVKGRKVKIFYSTQVGVAPPTFVVASNFPKFIRTSYKKFLENQFRYFFGFEGSPMRFLWKDKSGNAKEQDSAE